MSSILLSNPFPAAPAPSHLTAEVPATADPIAAVQNGAAADTPDNATSFSGSGAGSSRQAENTALFQFKGTGKWPQPAKATGGSVIGAQTQANASRSTVRELPLGPDLPAVEMPDPLPTSPFLKPNKDVA
ncbi:MAG: hypothetical protein WA782_18345 [Sulfitobacter sp.]